MKFTKRHSKKCNRERTKLWRKAKSILFYCFTPSFNPADFDKNENYELEKEFYENWINQRVMFVPEEIDEENEEDGSLRIAQLQDVENSFQMEMSFIFDKNEAVNSNQGNNIQEVSDSALNSSLSRSSVIRQTKIINSVGSQVDFCHIDQPPVRKVKKCTEKIKTAEKACKISQAFSKKNYVHNYNLLHKEKYPEQVPKIPKTAEDYANYADLFPDKK